jgi:methanogenic corrinoid protein MtbC1
MDASPANASAPPDRSALGRTFRRYEQAVAEAVTDAFLARHPDWVVRYGDRARQAGIEDARFHVQFLGAAIESDSRPAFRDYMHWTAGVLKARGIESLFLWENLTQVQDALTPYLTEGDRGLVTDFVQYAKSREPDNAAASEEGPLALTRRLFVQAIVAGGRQAALTIALEALRQGAAVQDVYADVFQDALYEVGRLWESNAITVAQEHMATAMTQYVMAHVFGQIAAPVSSRGVAIMTGVPGELHHVGALMVSDMLEANGWQVQFLGSNLPIASILHTIVEAKPQILGISVTMLFNVHQATRLIAEARRAAGSIRVVVGGSAFRFGAWRTTGADDYASDVRSAVARLCPGVPA